jgi:hypothetical protein
MAWHQWWQFTLATNRYFHCVEKSVERRFPRLLSFISQMAHRNPARPFIADADRSARSFGGWRGATAFLVPSRPGATSPNSKAVAAYKWVTPLFVHVKLASILRRRKLAKKAQSCLEIISHQMKNGDYVFVRLFLSNLKGI